MTSFRPWIIKMSRIFCLKNEKRWNTHAEVVLRARLYSVCLVKSHPPWPTQKQTNFASHTKHRLTLSPFFSVFFFFFPLSTWQLYWQHTHKFNISYRELADFTQRILREQRMFAKYSKTRFSYWVTNLTTMKTPQRVCWKPHNTKSTRECNRI